MTSTVLKTLDITAPIPIEDLTQVKLDGTGVFDKFLSLHRIILDREFKEARIAGKEYSDVFTKTYIANLELSIRFLLEKEKQAYEIDLLDSQIRKMNAEVLLAEKQIILADKELTLKDRELDLLEKQIELTEQKVITEQAQTDPSVIKEGSVIAMNNKVLQAQVDGFKRDAEQKAANTLLQTWIVRLNNDAALTNDANMLKDSYIGRAVETMMEGIGADTSGRDETDQ